MDTTQTFLPNTDPPKTEGTPETTDFFDFVNTTDASNTFNRSLKSLGVFIEQNNNNNNTEITKTEPKDCQYDNVFWNDKDNMRIETAILDDLNNWNQNVNVGDNTDGSVYTLTVLNSNDTWYKVPEETPPTTSKQKSDIDLDSFLNTIPENNSNFYYNHQYEQKNESYFEDSGYCESKEEISFDPVNFNWKNDTNNNDNVTQDSLLRNALQGKAFQRNYTVTKKEEYAENSLLINEYPMNDIKTNNLDDIFKEINTFTEDYEKLKRIASEVDCTPIPMCSTDMFVLQEPVDRLSIQTQKCMNKKYTKRSSVSNISIKNGIRKERSLHYCNICNKGFKDKYSVNVHVRTHTGEKPFACNLCGKSFRQKAHLAKHYQTHLAQSQKHHLPNGHCSKNKAKTVTEQNR